MPLNLAGITPAFFVALAERIARQTSRPTAGRTVGQRNERCAGGLVGSSSMSVGLDRVAFVRPINVSPNGELGVANEPHKKTVDACVCARISCARARENP